MLWIAIVRILPSAERVHGPEFPVFLRCVMAACSEAERFQNFDVSVARSAMISLEVDSVW